MQVTVECEEEPYSVFQMVPLWSWNTPNPVFKIMPLFDAEYSETVGDT